MDWIKAAEGSQGTCGAGNGGLASSPLPFPCSAFPGTGNPSPTACSRDGEPVPYGLISRQGTLPCGLILGQGTLPCEHTVYLSMSSVACLLSGLHLIRPSVRTGAPSPQGEGFACSLLPVPCSLISPLTYGDRRVILPLDKSSRREETAGQDRFKRYHVPV